MTQPARSREAGQSFETVKHLETIVEHLKTIVKHFETCTSQPSSDLRPTRLLKQAPGSYT